jgi:thiamine biosynthesis lipoprotein
MPPTSPLPTRTSQPTCARWPALGTTAEVHVTQAAALSEACALVTAELERIDRACSRFRPDSDLERVNDGAPRAVAVSELLIEAVEVGLRAVRVSEGYVDPALGTALLLAGYDRDFERLGLPIDAKRMRIRAHRLAGWRTIEIDRKRSTISIGRGVRLDLGATAKALAADRAVAQVYRATGVGALVNLGGDLAVAGAPPAGGWRVFVTEDHRSSLDAPGQLVEIVGGGLATSSVARRHWLADGEARHHIIDPYTGAPARSCWRTVSVAAATCVDANVASTAALVRGESAVVWLLDARLPARLVGNDGAVRTLGDWPAEGGTR